MGQLRECVKRNVNAGLGRCGVKLVNASWGPRGFARALGRAKAKGVVVTTVVDVGAARGEWTLECQGIFPDAEYLLVEPLEENESYLASLRNHSSRLAYWMGAVGAQPGEESFFVHGDQSSFLTSEYASKEDSSVRSVRVQTLDAVVQECLGRWPQLVKADVQGSELEVLRGASSCLKAAELVLLEVSFQEIYKGGVLVHEVISYMAGQGFRIYDMCTYTQRPLDGELAQADILFAKEGSVLFANVGWA